MRDKQQIMRVWKRAGCALSIVLFTMLFVSLASAQQKYVVSCVGAPAKSRWVPVIREAYRQIGLNVTFRRVPAERALDIANRGVADAELVRIAGVEREYPNLIPVPAKLPPIEVVAFVRDSSLKIPDWKALRKYRVGIVIGLKYAERGTKGIDVITVAEPHRLFSLLEAGRVDVAIYTRHRGMELIRQAGFKGVGPLEQSLENIPMFHYVHRRNRALIPDLVKVLTGMWEDGAMNRLME